MIDSRFRFWESLDSDLFDLSFIKSENLAAVDVNCLDSVIKSLEVEIDRNDTRPICWSQSLKASCHWFVHEFAGRENSLQFFLFII